MSRDLSLRHDLLDRQIVDADEVPIGRVVDVEIASGISREAPSVSALLTGSQALGQRLGGNLGRWMEGSSQRLRPRDDGPGPTRLGVEEIAEIGLAVRLRKPLAQLRELAPLEHWLDEHLIGRLPRARHESD